MTRSRAQNVWSGKCALYVDRRIETAKQLYTYSYTASTYTKAITARVKTNYVPARYNSKIKHMSIKLLCNIITNNNKDYLKFVLNVLSYNQISGNSFIIA